MKTATVEALGIKLQHHRAKIENNKINIGKFCVTEVMHNEWEVTTQSGRYLDTFARRDQAVAFVKALRSRQ